MLRGFSLRDFGASLNTAESHTNESSQGKIGLCETVNKQKCTHLGMFLASDLSCYNLNTKIQAIYNPVSDDDVFIEIQLSDSKNKSDIKKYRIKVGDKVINIKNNYSCTDLDGNVCPVFNGNMGKVTNVTKNGITIDFVGIGEVWFGRDNFKNLELGYCITTHKSQGSGFKSTIIALDGSSYIMNNAELLYTAITRAKKYCVLVATNSAVRSAISRKEVNNKQTYLKDMLNDRNEFKEDNND